VSELLQIFIDVIVPIFLIVGAAFWVGRRLNPDIRSLSTVLIYLFIPALSFRTMIRLPIDGVQDVVTGEFGRAFAQIALLVAIMWVVAAVVGRMLKLDRRTGSAFTLSITQINAGNLGIPLNTFAFGAVGSEMALLYYVSSAIIGAVTGVFIASRGQKSVMGALWNVIRVPASTSALLGLALNVFDVAMPLPLDRAISLLGDGTIPGMIVLLGLLISRIRIRHAPWKLVSLAALIRLFGGAAIGVALAQVLGVTGIQYNVAVLQSAVPTAVMANALAAEFGSDAEFTSAATLVGTLASIGTLTLWIALLR
jgi:predicted permease